MGGGRSTADELNTHKKRAQTTRAAAARWSDDAKSSRLPVWSTLDPLNGHPRESAHPDATQIGIVLDVTGSQRTVPLDVRDAIAKLLGLLTLQGYVPHPALMFYFLGDSHSDRWPHQISEWESEIGPIEEILSHAIMEGNGGGGRPPRESYEEAAWYILNRTAIRNTNPRFLFIIGDEMPYENVSAASIAKQFGIEIQGDIPREDIFRQLREEWNVYLIRCATASFPPGSTEGDAIEGVWSDLIGTENILHLDTASEICDMIAGVTGFNMGVPLATLSTDIGNASVSNALALLPPAFSTGGRTLSQQRQNNRQIRRIR